MKISRSTYETSPFIIQTDALERLFNEIVAALPIAEIQARCSDKLDRKFNTFDEFRGFNNPKRSSIYELQIVAHDTGYANRLSLTLNNEKRRNCRISIDADEDIAIRLNDSCIDFLDAAKPWYTLIAKADWYLVVFGSWAMYQLIVVAVMIARYGNQSLVFSADGFNLIAIVRSFAVGIAPIIFGVVLNALRDRFFSMGIFAIGDGVTRNGGDEVIRTVVIVAFVLSIASSIVVSLLV